MKPLQTRAVTVAMTMACALASIPHPGWAAPKCPPSYNATDAAKSHKLFLYFPEMNDASFPAFDSHVSPAQKFDVADLDPAIGTTTALENRIHDIVVDDYCEFN